VKKHVHHEMVISHAEIIGKYQVTGRVLLLPITGNGDINITLGNGRTDRRGNSWKSSLTL
jgi:hypothetical protein